MRELILSGEGVTLTDVYTAGGEVLMGSLRSQRESSDRAAREIAELAGDLRRVKINAEEAELEVRMKSLQVELTAKQVEKQLLIRTSENVEGELSQDRTRMSEMRGSDAVNGESK
jgi:circadian clock protein KaiC